MSLDLLVALDPACSAAVMSGDPVSVQPEVSGALLRYSRASLGADASSERGRGSSVLSVGVVSVESVMVEVVPQVAVTGEGLSTDQVGDETLVLDQGVSVVQMVASLLVPGNSHTSWTSVVMSL